MGFAEWKLKCVVKGQPFCSLPNPCPPGNSQERPSDYTRVCPVPRTIHGSRTPLAMVSHSKLFFQYIFSIHRRPCSCLIYKKNPSFAGKTFDFFDLVKLDQTAVIYL